MFGLLQRLLDAFVRLAMDLATALMGGILRAPVTAVEQVREARPQELSGQALVPRVDLDARHWVAERSGRVVGVVSLRHGEPPGPGMPEHELFGMAVSPEWRGKGIGDALLDALPAALGVWSDVDQRALALFERHDFEVVPGPSTPGHRRMRRSASQPRRT